MKEIYKNCGITRTIALIIYLNQDVSIGLSPTIKFPLSFNWRINSSDNSTCSLFPLHTHFSERFIEYTVPSAAYNRYSAKPSHVYGWYSSLFRASNIPITFPVVPFSGSVIGVCSLLTGTVVSVGTSAFTAFVSAFSSETLELRSWGMTSWMIAFTVSRAVSDRRRLFCVIRYFSLSFGRGTARRLDAPVIAASSRVSTPSESLSHHI